MRGKPSPLVRWSWPSSSSSRSARSPAFYKCCQTPLFLSWLSQSAPSAACCVRSPGYTSAVVYPACSLNSWSSCSAPRCCPCSTGISWAPPSVPLSSAASPLFLLPALSICPAPFLFCWCIYSHFAVAGLFGKRAECCSRRPPGRPYWALQHNRGSPALLLRPPFWKSSLPLLPTSP